MSMVRNDRLEDALAMLCERLIKSGAMSPEDKKAAIDNTAMALRETYPDGVPLDLFTDPVKRKNLMVGLVSAPVMANNPDLNLNFDLTLFLKPDMEPAEVKTLFKTFLLELNKLQPKNKQRSKEEIDAEADALLDNQKQDQLEAEESSNLARSKYVSNALEEIYKILYGVTKSGERVIQITDKGDMGIVNTEAVYTRGGGSKYHGRGLSGDSTTDPNVEASAATRLALISGLNAEEFTELNDRGLVRLGPPTLKSR